MPRKNRDIIDRHSRDEWLAVIGQWCHSERDRAILVRAWLDGLTYAQLADEFDPLTVDRIKQILSKYQGITHKLPEI